MQEEAIGFDALYDLVIFLGSGIVSRRTTNRIVTIVISIQCSLIITLLATIMEKCQKRNNGSMSLPLF
jgi:hypothetical protein